jgi:hypothetical protein
MIRQYLPNNNETATVTFRQEILPTKQPQSGNSGNKRRGAGVLLLLLSKFSMVLKNHQTKTGGEKDHCSIPPNSITPKSRTATKRWLPMHAVAIPSPSQPKYPRRGAPFPHGPVST